MAKSWEELGNRIMRARKDQGLTQLDLASAIRVERTSITKIEAGQRTVDSFELALIAEVLRRPISWFVSEPPPSVVSRRAERDEVVREADVLLESLAQDVEQLIELGVLEPRVIEPFSIDAIDATEQAALRARRVAGLREDEPAWELIQIVERLGLYAFVLDLREAGGQSSEGSYVALRRGGVALINRSSEGGRRRFTIAHELGHHVLNDQYAAEWIVGTATEREKVINAFAIHFLMPRAAVVRRWAQLRGSSDPRGAAIHLAVEFGMSWSAACAQLRRVGCLSELELETLIRQTPLGSELLERELAIRTDTIFVPPMYAASVIRALKRGKIGPQRALELLHGSLCEHDLPPERELSLDAMNAELELLPD